MTGKRPKSGGEENEASDDFLQAFGARVRAARARNKLTYAQLGELTGYAPSYIFSMEKEGSNVTLKTLMKVAAALQVSPRDLLPETAEEVMSLKGVQELVRSLQEALKQRQAAEDVVLERLYAVSNFLERLHPPKKGTKSDSDAEN